MFLSYTIYTIWQDFVSHETESSTISLYKEFLNGEMMTKKESMDVARSILSQKVFLFILLRWLPMIKLVNNERYKCDNNQRHQQWQPHSTRQA